MKISNATVTSKQNFIEKYHRLMKNLYFIFRLLFFTSNECFAHFNVQQLLSNLIHFVLFSQVHLKITLKMKTISFYFIEFRILRYVLHCSMFFGVKLENPKINKWGRGGGGPNNSRGGGGGRGLDLFFKKNKLGAPFIQELTVFKREWWKKCLFS